jgi:hypothetical protein
MPCISAHFRAFPPPLAAACAFAFRIFLRSWGAVASSQGSRSWDLAASRSCRRGAAGDADGIQRIPVVVLATPAATTYLRAFVVVCKDPGRPMSFAHLHYVLWYLYNFKPLSLTASSVLIRTALISLRHSDTKLLSTRRARAHFREIHFVHISHPRKSVRFTRRFSMLCCASKQPESPQRLCSCT